MGYDVIAVMGPTATGKSALAVDLARKLNGEVVSADSMQVYRGMDIGTAKATAAERGGVPHHMLDVVNPAQPYSVAQYVAEASGCCEALLREGKIPILAGGTGHYLDSLLEGRTFEPESPDRISLRKTLEQEYSDQGGPAMLARLRTVDPLRAERLSPQDRKRILRAMEYYRLTGETLTEHDRRTRAQPPRYAALRVVLDYENRETLNQRIDERVEEMIQNGLFEEVQRLLQSGLSPECTAMQAIGYKEAALGLQGRIPLSEAVQLIQLRSRQYGKRQRTWFRHERDALRIFWKDRPAIPQAAEAVAQAYRAGKLPEEDRDRELYL